MVPGPVARRVASNSHEEVIAMWIGISVIAAAIVLGLLAIVVGAGGLGPLRFGDRRQLPPVSGLGGDTGLFR